jgi:hypothetical protein
MAEFFCAFCASVGFTLGITRMLTTRIGNLQKQIDELEHELEEMKRK